MNKEYIYSFYELCDLIAKDKNLQEGNYNFDLIFNANDETKLMIVKISPPKNKLKFEEQDNG